MAPGRPGGGDGRRGGGRRPAPARGRAPQANPRRTEAGGTWVPKEQGSGAAKAADPTDGNEGPTEEAESQQVSDTGGTSGEWLAADEAKRPSVDDKKRSRQAAHDPASHGAQAEDEEEEHWEAGEEPEAPLTTADWRKLKTLFSQRVHLDAASGWLQVKLSGCGLGDEQAGLLAHYLEALLPAPKHVGCTAPLAWSSLELDTNALSDKGLAALLDVCERRRVYFKRLRLYRNKLADYGGYRLATALRKQASAVEELHLSHNRLSARSLIHICMAIVANPAYPRRVEGAKQIPCWVRMEHNYVSRPLDVIKLLRQETQANVCLATDRGRCGPQWCGQESPAGTPKAHFFSLEEQHVAGTVRPGYLPTLRQCIRKLFRDEWAWEELPHCEPLGCEADPWNEDNWGEQPWQEPEVWQEQWPEEWLEEAWEEDQWDENNWQEKKWEGKENKWQEQLEDLQEQLEVWEEDGWQEQEAKKNEKQARRQAPDTSDGAPEAPKAKKNATWRPKAVQAAEMEKPSESSDSSHAQAQSSSGQRLLAALQGDQGALRSLEAHLDQDPTGAHRTPLKMPPIPTAKRSAVEEERDRRTAVANSLAALGVTPAAAAALAVSPPPPGLGLLEVTHGPPSSPESRPANGAGSPSLSASLAAAGLGPDVAGALGAWSLCHPTGPVGRTLSDEARAQKHRTEDATPVLLGRSDSTKTRPPPGEAEQLALKAQQTGHVQYLPNNPLTLHPGHAEAVDGTWLSVSAVPMPPSLQSAQRYDTGRTASPFSSPDAQGFSPDQAAANSGAPSALPFSGPPQTPPSTVLAKNMFGTPSSAATSFLANLPGTPSPDGALYSHTLSADAPVFTPLSANDGLSSYAALHPLPDFSAAAAEASGARHESASTPRSNANAKLSPRSSSNTSTPGTDAADAPSNKISIEHRDKDGDACGETFGSTVTDLEKRLLGERSRAQDAREEASRLCAALRESARFPHLEPDLLRESVCLAATVGWDNVNWKRQYTALHLAGHLGRVEVLPLLLALRADPGAKDSKDRTAVDVARAAQHEGFAEALERLATSGEDEPDAPRVDVREVEGGRPDGEPEA